MKSSPRLVGEALFLLSLACCAASGCQERTPRQTEFMKAEGILISQRELRTRVHAFGPRFAGLVEETGYKILRETDDPAMRTAARGWMITVIPVAYRAILQPDPLAALLDTWVFAGQMRACFETGAGVREFGPWQSKVVSTCLRIESELRELAQDVHDADRFAEANAAVTRWVEENPVGQDSWVRRSPTALLASLRGEDSRGTLAAVASMGEELEALRSEMNLYTEQLPKQVRWQIEDTLEEQGFNETPKDLNSMAKSLETVAGVAKESPSIVTTELSRTMEWAHEERLDVLQSIERLLTTALNDIQDQRQATVTVLREERAAVFEELKSERQEVLTTIEGLTERVLLETSTQGAELIDHFFLRTLQALAAVLAIGGILAAWLSRRRKKAAPSPKER